MAKRFKPLDIEKDYKKIWPYNITYEMFSEIKHIDISVFTQIIKEELKKKRSRCDILLLQRWHDS